MQYRRDPVERSSSRTQTDRPTAEVLSCLSIIGLIEHLLSCRDGCAQNLHYRLIVAGDMQLSFGRSNDKLRDDENSLRSLINSDLKFQAGQFATSAIFTNEH